MRKISAVSAECIAVLILLAIALSTDLAAKDKTTARQPEKTTNTTLSNQEQIKALYDKLGWPASSSTSSSSSRTGEQINWQVISGGATNGSSANYGLLGTVGQTAVGAGSSTNYRLYQGYWQDFGEGGCCDLAGDSNDDGGVDVSDLTFTVAYMFQGGPAPVCMDEADLQADCAVDIGDLTYRVTWMFQGGPDPVCGCVL